MPKALVDVQGHSLIDFSIHEFELASIRRLVLHIGPWTTEFAQKLEELKVRLGNFGCALSVEHCEGPEQTLLEALQQCLLEVQGDIIYWDGDVIVPPGTLRNFTNSIAVSDNDAAVICSPALLAPSHLQVTCKNGRAVTPSSTLSMGPFCGIGAYLLRQTVCQLILNNTSLSDIDEVISQWVREQNSLGVHKIGQEWAVIHTPNDLETARSAQWIRQFFQR
jgi:choline kinase